MGIKVSVIIPTLNAEKELPLLLEKLHSQRLKADEIIVVDSNSDDGTATICNKDKTVRLIQIEREEFDHGRTRDMALRESMGDIVVFLTQDAIPANDELLEKLVTPLSEDKVVLSTGRQIPKPNASRRESLIRQFNYPEKGHIRSMQDIPRMGIKTFFCSDVCAAYRKDVYYQLGGFEYPIKTNEDMLFAAKVINAGYRIAYVSDALVYHSHDFTLKEQYRRNYIQGYEMERHKDALNHVTQEYEGLRLMKHVSKQLIVHGHIGSFLYFGIDCFVRLIGSKAGRKKWKKEMR